LVENKGITIITQHNFKLSIIRPLCQCPQRACPCGGRGKMRKKESDPLCPLIIDNEDPFMPSKGWAEMIKKVYGG